MPSPAPAPSKPDTNPDTKPVIPAPSREEDPGAIPQPAPCPPTTCPLKDGWDAVSMPPAPVKRGWIND